MKYRISLLTLLLAICNCGIAQTLQTVVDNGNTTISPVKFFGHVDFGDAFDPVSYGSVQITRLANLDPKFHLSFIRNGQMVYGMGFLYNSSVFAIQSGSDNRSNRGIFMDANGSVGIGTTTPGSNFDVKGQIAVSGTGAGVNFLDRNDNSKVLQFFNSDGNLNLYASGYGNAGNKITLTASGRIGVGNTTPEASLEILKSYSSGPNKALKFFYNGSWNSTLEANAFRFMDVGSTEGGKILQLNGYGLGIGFDPPLYSSTDKLYVNGNVGIGTTDPKGYKLAVAGNMIAESVKVKLQGTWPDYVFAKEYALPSLAETEKHIKEKGHLPEIPSAAEVKANGLDVEDINAKLLKKVEELTLYLIEQQKEIHILKEKVQKIENPK